MEYSIEECRIRPLISVTGIVTVHYFELGRDFSGYTEAHDSWELVYADSSDIVCYADGREVLLKEGEVLFHKPNESHSLCAAGKRSPNVFIITFFCKSRAMRFFEGRRMHVETACKSLIYSMIEESERIPVLPYSGQEGALPTVPRIGQAQVIKNLLELLLIRLMRGAQSLTSSDGGVLREGDCARVSGRVVEYMKAHVEERLSVADLCEVLHYNKSYLFKEFKRELGCSMMAYYVKLKVDRAKRMLRDTNRSVTEISDALSFDNPNYFSKTFKRITGYTPSRYRAMRKGNQQK